jgi:hypothetical protein
MKVSWVRGLLILSLFFSLALKQNDVVELEQYFNARYSANFLKTTQNVKFVIPPGTQGKIEDVKKFDSGNFGLQVTLQNGKNKGEKVWVYYKPSSPGMKLFEGEAAKSASTKVVEDAKSTETTEATSAWRTPAGEPIPLVVTKEYAEELMKKVDTVNDKIKIVETKNQNPCDDDCKLAQQTYATDVPKQEENPQARREPVKAAGVRDEASPVTKHFEKLKVEKALVKASPIPVLRKAEVAKSEAVDFVPAAAQQDPPTLRKIPYTENRQRINFPKCSNIYNDDLQVCDQPGYGKTAIMVTNYTKRNYAKGEGAVYRSWDVSAPSAARQDAGIWISDVFSKKDSQDRISLIMLFPRETMPAVQATGNKYVVTLPNGETASFEKSTGRIIGGVFKEQGQKMGSSPKVTYGGKGVMIRADNTAGNNEARIGGTATVTKQGKSCTIPKKNLWGQSESGGNGFKFFSDKDLDGFLKSKCGFGLY